MTGRKIFITGGSRGIGAALVRKFAAAGDRVTFTHANSDVMAMAAETGAKALRVDSADRNATITAIAGEGPIDVLIANAGVAVLGDPLMLDPDAIDRMIDINIRGSYFAAVEAARNMPDNGRILVIGATGGDHMPFPGAAAYAMTKAALQGMVRGLARDFGHRGITVNAVAPGFIDTDMTRVLPDDQRQALAAGIPLARLGDPQDIAMAVLYLVASSGAYVTGQTLHVNGGMYMP